MRGARQSPPPVRAIALAAGVALAAAGLLSPATADPATADPARATAPQRIVSLNVCVDQLVLLLADREQIAALSYAAANPAQSTMAEAAEGLPLLYGHAEEVLPYAPDLVLAGNFTSRPAVALLRRLGYEVQEIPDALTLADIRDNIVAVAAAVGHPERGTALLARFDAGLASAAPPDDGRTPAVAFLSLGLYGAGEGTLVDDMLRAAGLANAATRWGVNFIGPVNLETLLLDPPDGLVLGLDSTTETSLSSAVLAHPALQRVKEQVPVRNIRGREWVCGTPAVVEVVAALAAMRREIVAAAPDGG